MTRSPSSSWVCVALLGLLLACDRTISANDYNRACTQDAQCSLVTDGDVCDNGCGCPNAAVNNDALVEFTTDRGSQARGCGPRFVGGAEACADCSTTAVCRAGRCEAQP